MKRLLVTLAAFVLSSGASAFVPPYHVSSLLATGTATLQVSGECSLPIKTYNNVQYGQIKDSANALVGTGFIDESNRIIALYNGEYGIGVSSYSNSSPATIIVTKDRLSFVGDALMSFIKTDGGVGCSAITAWPRTNTYVKTRQDEIQNTQTIKTKQYFSGSNDELKNCKVIGKARKCYYGKFEGKFTFEGRLDPWN